MKMKDATLTRAAIAALPYTVEQLPATSAALARLTWRTPRTVARWLNGTARIPRDVRERLTKMIDATRAIGVGARKRK